jgi:hypothetical protein
MNCILTCRPISHDDDDDEEEQTNSGALVRKRTIPTERPPHVGEVSAKFEEDGGLNI